MLVNQKDKTKAGQWNSLGTYNFDAGACSIKLSDNADRRLVADAIRVVKK